MVGLITPVGKATGRRSGSVFPLPFRVRRLQRTRFPLRSSRVSISSQAPPPDGVPRHQDAAVEAAVTLISSRRLLFFLRSGLRIPDSDQTIDPAPPAPLTPKRLGLT